MTATIEMPLPTMRHDGESKPVPDAAFEMGFHRLTANEAARAIRKLIDARPHVSFGVLEVGKVYYYKTSHRPSCRVLAVHKVTPAGKQAVVSYHPNEETIRINAGSYTYEGDCFIELEELTLSFWGLNHDSIVFEAVARGLNVPPLVRREYPGLFLEIPDRFAKPAEYGATTAAERVKTALQPAMGRSPGPKQVAAWIEGARDKLVRFLSESIRLADVNPATAPHYERALAEFHELIDFYSWLLPHVSPGGVFFLNPTDADERTPLEAESTGALA